MKAQEGQEGSRLQRTYEESEAEACWRRFHRNLEMPLLAKLYFSAAQALVGLHVFAAVFVDVEAVVTYAAFIFVLIAYYLVSAPAQRRLLRVADRNGILSLKRRMGSFIHLYLVILASRLSPEQWKRMATLRLWQMLCDVVFVLGLFCGFKAPVEWLGRHTVIFQYLYFRLTE
jgi:hypothetical protein